MAVPDTVTRTLADRDVAGKTCLEAGAGIGNMTAGLLAAGAEHVYAVTKDRRHAANVRERIAKETGEQDRVTLLEADLHQIPLPDDSVGVVTAHALFNVLPNAAAAPIAREVSRVAAPGATLVVKYLGGKWFETRSVSSSRKTKSSVRPRGFTVLSVPSRNGRMDAGEFNSPRPPREGLAGINTRTHRCVREGWGLHCPRQCPSHHVNDVDFERHRISISCLSQRWIKVFNPSLGCSDCTLLYESRLIKDSCWLHPRGQVVRDASRLVISEIENFRTTPRHSPCSSVDCPALAGHSIVKPAGESCATITAERDLVAVGRAASRVHQMGNRLCVRVYPQNDFATLS
jgi:SAM-dependent methyltransferase